jgi:DNA polymerase III alpha subunit
MLELVCLLSISDPSGSVECAIFPNAYQRLGQPALLREGAFLVARGRLVHEETTGTKVWIEQIVPVSGSGAHLRALATAVEHQRYNLSTRRTAPAHSTATSLCNCWMAAARRYRPMTWPAEA